MHGIGVTKLAELLGEITGDGSGHGSEGRPGPQPSVLRSPTYQRLAEQVRVLVGDGRLAVGVRLPAERELAVALGCSRTTVTHAYRELRDSGWADARRGAGTWTRLPDGPGRSGGAWVQGPAVEGVVDLVHAAPEAPPQMMDAVEAATRALPRELAGHGYDPTGMLALRTRIAERYSARGLPTTPDHVVVTSGALHALSTAVATLVGPGDRVLVEHPTYPNALDAITDVGARPVPVALGPDPLSAPGPDPGVGLVADLVRTARQTAPRAAYLMPDFHNPTGALLDAAGRERLAQRLARLDVVSIVDETFVELALDDDPPAPFAAHAADEHVVTVGTLSKIAWGGLRIGWARTAPDLAAALRRRISRAQLAPPVLDQLVACELFDVLDTVRDERRTLLRGRRDATVALLAEQLPSWTVPVPPGGLALWCGIGAPISTALASRAPSVGLRLAAGPRFGTGHAFDDQLRIPFTLSVEALTRGIGRLAALARGIAEPSSAPDEDMVV